MDINAILYFAVNICFNVMLLEHNFSSLRDTLRFLGLLTVLSKDMEVRCSHKVLPVHWDLTQHGDKIIIIGSSRLNPLSRDPLDARRTNNHSIERSLKNQSGSLNLS